MKKHLKKKGTDIKNESKKVSSNFNSSAQKKGRKWNEAPCSRWKHKSRTLKFFATKLINLKDCCHATLTSKVSVSAVNCYTRSLSRKTYLLCIKCRRSQTFLMNLVFSKKEDRWHFLTNLGTPLSKSLFIFDTQVKWIDCFKKGTCPRLQSS